MSTIPVTPNDVTPPGEDLSPGPASPLPRWVRPALWVNLVCQLGILVTGGLVRVTGSGLGCPTWPQCVPGSFTPVPYQAQGYHKDIEFGNRMLTFVLVLAAVGALVAVVVWVLAGRVPPPARRRLIVLGVVPIAGVFVQAIIGGISVRLALTPASVALHFLPSIALISVSTILVAGLGPDVPPTPRRDVRLLSAAAAVVGFVVIAIGTVVTGAGPHSGDATKPVRFPINPRDVAVVHTDAVWLFVGLVLALLVVVRVTDTHPLLRRRVLGLVGVTFASGVVGYLQYFLGLPGGLVVVHMLLAGMLAVALTTVLLGVHGTRWLVGGPAR